MTAPLLSIENLSIGFTGLNDQPVFIVRDVNLTLAAGETLGLVGDLGLVGVSQSSSRALER